MLEAIVGTILAVFVAVTIIGEVGRWIKDSVSEFFFGLPTTEVTMTEDFLIDDLAKTFALAKVFNPEEKGEVTLEAFEMDFDLLDYEQEYYDRSDTKGFEAEYRVMYDIYCNRIASAYTFEPLEWKITEKEPVVEVDIMLSDGRKIGEAGYVYDFDSNTWTATSLTPVK